MGPRFLIDTNAAIDLLEGKLPAASRYWLDAVVDSQQYAISVITRIELLSPKSTPAQRAPFEELIDIAAVYGLPVEIIRETIRLRRHHRCKLPDAIIAATALVFNLTLITRDVGFRTITGLSVLDPHDAASLPKLT